MGKEMQFIKEVLVVNKYNKPIGSAQYEDCHKEGLYHRISTLFLFSNPDLTDMWVAIRAKKLPTSPEKICAAASGHVEIGQTYKDAVIAETDIELFSGIGDGERIPKELKIPSDPQRIFYTSSRPNNKEFKALFVAQYNGEFQPDSREVEKVEKHSIEEILADISINPEKYSPSFIVEIINYLGMHDKVLREQGLIEKLQETFGSYYIDTNFRRRNP